MITIQDFTEAHITDAQRIAFDNYREERSVVPCLPSVDNIPDLQEFADNGLGVAAFENDILVGYLCCYRPWDNAFDSTAKGTFSPIHANGAVRENRDRIYHRLYQAAARKWVAQHIAYHAIGLYAHDKASIDAMFTYGFGLRCVDAIRPMECLPIQMNQDASYAELSHSKLSRIRDMRRMLSAHLGDSPCFMYSHEIQYQEWLTRAEARHSRIFVANRNNSPVAFLEIAEGGAENFATEVDDVRNICGAYCIPDCRGTGIFQSLLNYTIETLRAEGWQRLGVDFESTNPTANGFWLKHFTAYTNSVIRRIDECAISNK